MLEALRRDADEFAALVGSPVPAGWPQFDEGIEFTIDVLRERPAQAQWWLHLFFDDDVLVGSGGFVGPPDDGVVEIGYEIAPAYRGRGRATGAARALAAQAFAAGNVHTVLAHTASHRSASTSVLERIGFGFLGTFPDEEEGTVWRWELACPEVPLSPFSALKR
ncbi:GNAT family N-acetyltransferase [Mycolicibacterium sediminis]|uniref:N-acetyltransferase domain-containing protein n=1 Tax=Mycolicibacterium sediminis TaxID=1286180 RepID=A0A7I7QM70_9MYCO|nr:GNAT family N-acetyltransferase [Mycolicibacterium sediminis]BBY27382.1 hypothetical protein MSEDJ_14780 [Mycolicibacterium sediminis]